MFQFPRLASAAYGFNCRWFRITGTGFPHSEISGSTLARSYPELIAVCHVLHRLSVPRHPPHALSSLAEKHPAKTTRVRYTAVVTRPRCTTRVIHSVFVAGYPDAQYSVVKEHTLARTLKPVRQETFSNSPALPLRWRRVAVATDLHVI